MKHPHRLSPQAGIAIGPILFILAILAVIAAYMASGNGDYQVASGADRISADIAAQADLIRNSINQCNMQYTLAVSTGSVAPTSDPYPTSTGSGSDVKLLTCAPTGGASLWGATLLPPPSPGFNDWTYIDDAAAGGGRCFWTTPSTSNPAGNQAVVSGLTHAAAKFNSATAYNAANEVIYNPSSSSQKFTVWITMPTGTPNSDCLP